MTLNQATSSTEAQTIAEQRLPQRVRHELRFRRVQVKHIARITPHLIRVTLTGPDLQGFYSPGFDDHAKLLFPDPTSGALLLPSVNEEGKPQWGEGVKPATRDYTPRSFDAQANELTVDFALHRAGPATAWAEAAQVGDEIGIGGPRGSFLVPLAFDWHLLAGDDTALPAIWRRLQELPADAKALVFAEVDSAADEIELPSRAQVQIVWVHRENGAQAPLLEAIRATPFPQGDFHAWVAAESSTAKAIREHLLTERGANARWMRASGYWRRGSAATHDTLE